MEWYKYPWQNADMSENLSMGEIRHIWRSCIAHLRTGRTFELGTTRKFLEVRLYRVKVPRELRGRVEAVCARALEMGTFRNDEHYR